MEKTISTYRGYTAAELKSRADLPAQAGMTVSGTDVLCAKINTTLVRNCLGASSNKFSELCTHANVNVWSGFGPTVRTEVAGVLVNSHPAPYDIGDFMGYNHAAVTPAFLNNSHLLDTWVISGGTATLVADITIGEAKFVDLDISNHANCVGLALTVWDGLTLVGFGIEDLASCKDSISLSADVVGVSSEKTYTCKIYLTSSLTEFSQSLEDAVCQLTPLADYNATVKILSATALNLAGAGGWTLIGGSLNLSISFFYLTSFYRAAGDALGLIVQIRLYKQIDGTEEVTQIWTGDYTAGTTINPSPGSWVIHSTTPIPSYGYIAYLEFLETS